MCESVQVWSSCEKDFSPKNGLCNGSLGFQVLDAHSKILIVYLLAIYLSIPHIKSVVT